MKQCVLVFLMSILGVVHGTITQHAPTFSFSSLPTPPPSSKSPFNPPIPSAPVSTSYRTIISDMKAIMMQVGRVNCTEDVRRRTFLIYRNNQQLFETCVKDATYQIFPYPGVLPTPEQIQRLIQSVACMDLLSGVILAQFPECDVDMFSMRTAAEVLFRVKKDMEMKNSTPPTQVQFDELYHLNRAMNLLSENASLIQQVVERHATPVRISLSEITRIMNRIDVNPSISITPNMTIGRSDLRRSTTSLPPATDKKTTAHSVAMETNKTTMTKQPAAIKKSATSTPSSAIAMVLVLVGMSLAGFGLPQ